MTKLAVLIALALVLAVAHPVILGAVGALVLAATLGVWGVIVSKLIREGRYSYSRRAYP